MPDNLVNIDLGKLAKPATVLIRKISDAIGLLYEPTHVRRIAKARSDARKIKTLGDMEISELQRRGLQRLIFEEGRQQENIEKITTDAVRHLGADAKPEELSQDWITNFFQKARTFSDGEMQSLWSRLLAAEATSPGSYTRRTVEVVSLLEKSDANLFTDFCGFAVLGGGPAPLIFNLESEVYKSKELTFSKLTHLESIGLIKNFGPAFATVKTESDLVELEYFGTTISVRLQPQHHRNMPMGYVMFTSVGSQLFNICGRQPVEGFIPYLVEQFSKSGYEVTTQQQ
jgi:hypothetical protein